MTIWQYGLFWAIVIVGLTGGIWYAVDPASLMVTLGMEKKEDEAADASA